MLFLFNKYISSSGLEIEDYDYQKNKYNWDKIALNWLKILSNYL
jgi:hypothetical protein